MVNLIRHSTKLNHGSSTFWVLVYAKNRSLLGKQVIQNCLPQILEPIERQG